MNIILGKDKAKLLENKYVVLTLDSFKIANSDKTTTAYCVVENIPMDDLAQLESWKSLHENLMTAYNQMHWHFCEQAIEHLMGKWNRELDSFYTDLLARISQLKSQEDFTSWTPVIDRADTDTDPVFSHDS